ncbi:MAG TPA: succinyl-diaminopimelate desuccinylase [Acidimicrobiales bacterium]|nr:succinyl-diaminopimelate desuccinylase [Acidimicrobiales bacterium]
MTGRADITRDLLADTAGLVAISSPSHHEAALAAHLAERLAGLSHLSVERVGDNVIARTDAGRPRRVILAGHLDTVPAQDNETPQIDGDVCRGLGSTDMKGGLAVLALLAEQLRDPALDLTFLFYSCEEVDMRHSGLLQLRDLRPELLEGDVAILAEPTNCLVEAGCQGNLRLKLTVGGTRAHTARPWMGTNAIHRLGVVLQSVDAYEGRRPVIDGCHYREALQAVAVEGGVANNVVPDAASLTLNHRYAPDRDAVSARAAVEELLAPVLDPSAGDRIELLAASEAAAPGLTDPLLERLVSMTGPPVAKLGWTDVSFFSSLGLAATNFGPGDPTLAHTRDEWVSRADLEKAYLTLAQLLTG